MAAPRAIGQWFPLAQAACKSGVSRYTLWRLARRGVVRARQVNRTWHIHFGALWAYLHDPEVNRACNRRRNGR